MENRKTCRNAQCFCDGSCQDLIKSDINYTSVIPMENKTAEEILKEFENFCGNLAVSGDSPSSDTIKQYFDEYASQKLAEKDKEIERLKVILTKLPDLLHDSLGNRECEYTIKDLPENSCVDSGEFWITHNEVGSGEPLKQWIKSEIDKSLNK